MAKTFYFEELTNVGINPYEAVIASSREARRLNQTRLMSDTVEGPDKMTTSTNTPSELVELRQP